MNFILVHYNHIIIHLIFGIVPLSLLFCLGLEKNLIFFKRGFISNYFSQYILFLLIIVSIVYILYLFIILWNKKKRRDILYFFITYFLCIPFILQGPFYLSPADTIFHGNLLWDSLYMDSFKDLPNREFISKIIFSFLFESSNTTVWFSRLNIIFYFHILTSSFLVSSVYFSSRILGLKIKWSIVSVLTMILFFGTNRFSYFTYYSVAPSSINMGIYWLLSSLLINLVFYDKLIKLEKIAKLVYLYFIGFLIAPILYYHHKQEVGFLIYSYLLVSIILSIKLLTQFKYYSFRNYIWLPFLFIVLFFPTLTPLKKIFPLLNLTFDENFIPHILLIKNIIIIGKLNGPRIFDTLSFYGFLPIIAVITFLILPQYYKFNTSEKTNNFFIAMLPGLMPFWILLIPLNVLIWAKTISASEVFWRLTYTTQFWISIAYLLQIIEPKVILFIRRKMINFKNA